MRLSKNVRLKSSNGQVDMLLVENDLACAKLSLFGGHVLSYLPRSDNRDRLWVSSEAILDGSKAIRGGIPICWPWFGDHPSGNYPAHGYVRNQQWHVAECLDSESGTSIKLRPESANGAGLDGKLDLMLVVTVGEALTLQLTSKNVGETTLTFSAALHTYFNIYDIHQTRLTGLSGDYLDKTQQYATYDTPKPYAFGKETDNVHLNPVSRVVIEVPNFEIGVSMEGHDSVVVWNPWQEKSIAMTDMQDDGYGSMLCVESAITRGITLGPNEQHVLGQTIQ